MQHGNQHMREVVDNIDIVIVTGVDARLVQYAGLEARLNGENDRPHAATPTVPVVAEVVRLYILAGLQVINDPAKFAHLVDRNIAPAVRRPVGPWGQPPLEHPFHYRQRHSTTVAQQEVEREFHVVDRLGYLRRGAGPEEDGLVARAIAMWQVQVDDRPVLTRLAIKAYSLAGPIPVFALPLDTCVQFSLVVFKIGHQGSKHFVGDRLRYR